MDAPDVTVLAEGLEVEVRGGAIEVCRYSLYHAKWSSGAPIEDLTLTPAELDALVAWWAARRPTT